MLWSIKGPKIVQHFRALAWHLACAWPNFDSRLHMCPFPPAHIDECGPGGSLRSVPLVLKDLRNITSSCCYMELPAWLTETCWWDPWTYWTPLGSPQRFSKRRCITYWEKNISSIYDRVLLLYMRKSCQRIYILIVKEEILMVSNEWKDGPITLQKYLKSQ